MTPHSTYLNIRTATEAIRARAPFVPKVGMILGSGLGSIANFIEESVSIPYSEIPHFHPTSVEGHAGRLLLGKFWGVPVVALQGRLHVYEGYSMDEIVFPTRVICSLGIQSLVLTNAAGGINLNYKPGDLMIIMDHLNLMGDNPLKGPNIAKLGPRFPDMTEAYSRECVRLLQSGAKELGITAHLGVYAGIIGPTYETPAEVRMLRALGADAVGMSTVPEAIAANHLGVQVAGLSCVTNMAAGISTHKLSHEEVISNSKVMVDNLTTLLKLTVPSFVVKPTLEANP